MPSESKTESVMPAHPARRARHSAATVVCLTLALVLIWAPWMTPGFATNRVTDAFTTAWAGVADGCSLVRPGVRDVNRDLLGYTVTIEYACGMLPSDSAEYHHQAVVYVSPLATLHGVPRP